MVESMIMPALLLLLIGGTAALLLAVAARVFHVEVDPRISAVEEALPGANCGGCGYTGCSACAEATVAGKAAPSACVAGGPKVWAAVARTLGTDLAFVEARVAEHRCRGGFRADRRFDYEGVPDCRAAARLGGGDLACAHGCLGLGTCIRACPFGALTAGNEGIPVLDPARCVGCGTCERICPTSAIRIFGLTDRLLHFDRQDECVAPCRQLCPAQIDISAYVDLALEGNYEAAIGVIRDRNPLPVTCGRICPAPCEAGCRRAELPGEAAVRHNTIKRFLADWDHARADRPAPSRLPDTGKRVGIIGGGPAGLTAAWFLRRLGHDVTIVESLPKLGGMLRYGIPEYRLPKERLDSEIADILALGVKVELSTRVGIDVSFAEFEQRFDAVFLGAGAWDNHLLQLAGEQTLQGVYRGTEFLARRELGNAPDLTGQRVAVVGGGNTAIDAARTSLRLGASEVFIVYRRTRKEMPANEVEIVAAEEEGVQFLFLAAPGELKETDGRLTHLSYVRMELGEPDASGRRRPVPVEGADTLLQLDALIAAIGQKPLLDWYSPELQARGLKVTRWGTVETDPETLQTGLPNVFAAGDLWSGPGLVVEAIGTGRRAARSIHRLLRGEPLSFAEGTITAPRRLPQSAIGTPNGVEARNRTHLPELEVKDRVDNFSEVELTPPLAIMEEEARRCLYCGSICYDSDADRQERWRRRRPTLWRQLSDRLAAQPPLG